MEPPAAQEVEEANHRERGEEVGARERRENPNFAPRAEQDRHHPDERSDGKEEQDGAPPAVQCGHNEREVEHARRRNPHDDKSTQDARRFVGGKCPCFSDFEPVRTQRRARIGKILHIRFEQRHIRRRIFVDAQEVDADVALLVRRHPSLNGGVDLELCQLILWDGVEPRDMIVADALCDLLHALLVVKLQLRHALDEPER